MARITCSGCHKPKGHCYCCLLERAYNTVDIIILRHPSEAKHALGTASIVAKGLSNCQLIDIASVEQDPGLCQRLRQTGTYLVFPSDSSDTLGPSISPRITTLVFLDATWRKAKRLFFESPTLQSIPALSIHVAEKSRYRLRQSSIEHSLSTLEAVVAGLRCVEQCPDAYQNLLDVMDSVVEKQIAAMGLDTFQKNYSH